MAFRRHRGRQPQPLLNMAAVELGAQDGEWVPCSDDAARVAPASAPPNNLLLARDDAILREARLVSARPHGFCAQRERFKGVNFLHLRPYPLTLLSQVQSSQRNATLIVLLRRRALGFSDAP